MCSFYIFCFAISVYFLVLVSAEGVVKLSVNVLASVSAECQYITFGMVSLSAETKNLVLVGLYKAVIIVGILCDLRYKLK
jgi:hypothetical protein